MKGEELKASNFWSLKKAYANHIERLMIMGNYFLLSEIHPKHVYRWFMEVSINYLLKMSDFKRGDWCEKWDALFHSFLKKHLDYLKTNPRMSLILRSLIK